MPVELVPADWIKQNPSLRPHVVDPVLVPTVRELFGKWKDERHGVVVYVNQMFDSSQFGASSYLPRMVDTNEAGIQPAMQWLHDLPSQRQYPVDWIKPDEPLNECFVFRKGDKYVTLYTEDPVKDAPKDIPASEPLKRLRHHVTGAIERGEAEPVVEIPARKWMDHLEIETGAYYYVETSDCGDSVVPETVCGQMPGLAKKRKGALLLPGSDETEWDAEDAATKKQHQEWVTAIAHVIDYIEGRKIFRITRKHGVTWRMTEPRYLSSTDWHEAESEAAAKESARELYGHEEE